MKVILRLDLKPHEIKLFRIPHVLSLLFAMSQNGRTHF